jgi:hypothetical protein
MITELALLRVLPGADGCVRHRLAPTLDSANLYLLEVLWRDLASHSEGFEPSDAHARFMAPLAPMLAGPPLVIHVPA